MPSREQGTQLIRLNHRLSGAPYFSFEIRSAAYCACYHCRAAEQPRHSSRPLTNLPLLIGGACVAGFREHCRPRIWNKTHNITHYRVYQSEVCRLVCADGAPWGSGWTVERGDWQALDATKKPTCVRSLVSRNQHDILPRPVKRIGNELQLLYLMPLGSIDSDTAVGCNIKL